MASDVVEFLETWGPSMRVAVDRAAGHTSDTFHRRPMVFATDCSGLEAPIFALKALGYKVDHIWSCDKLQESQRFIAANFTPRYLFTDIFERSSSLASQKFTLCLDGYAAGFPCQPFSLMNNHRRMFADVRTQVFETVLKTISTFLPAFALLENVEQVLSARTELISYMRSHLEGKYLAVALPFCPTFLGDPVRRPRCWFLLIRADCARTTCVENLRQLASSILQSIVHSSNPPPVDSFLISSNNMTDVTPVRHQKKQKTCKWKEDEHKFLTKYELPQMPDYPEPPGCSPREASVWKICKYINMDLTQTSTFFADVSQSAFRTPNGNGIVPTLVRNSHIVMQQPGKDPRILTEQEKLLLHRFPVPSMNLPKQLSSSQLAGLCGNTQHVGVCAAMLLLCISFVDWDKFERRRSITTNSSSRRAHRQQTSAARKFDLIGWRWNPKITALENREL